MRKSIVGLLVPFMVFLGLLVVPNTSGAITVPGDERIADTTDPVLASVQFSKTFIPGKGVVSSVVLGRADKFPDNLGGSALAGADNGVMLLTDGGDRAPLRKEVRDEINRILTPNGANTACNDITANVYILGGTAAVSAAAESTLKSDGWCVFRLGGKTRIETALLIAGLVRKITGKFDFAMVARSDNPVDSAAAGALASKEGIPIVLSPTAAIDQTVLDFLFKGGNGTRFDVYMLGGTAALSAGVENKLIQGANGSNFPGTLVRRLSGNARDTTAIEIGKEYLVFNPNTSSSNVSVVVVNGYRDDTWVYALIAGALAWRENIVIYYVRDSKVDSPTCNFLGTLNPGPDAIKVLGPTSVVSKAAFDATRACAGPGGGGGGGGGGGTSVNVPAISQTNFDVKMTGGVAGQPPAYSQTFNTRIEVKSTGQVMGTLGQTNNSCGCSVKFDGFINQLNDALESTFNPNNKGLITVIEMTAVEQTTGGTPNGKFTITGKYFITNLGTANQPNPHAGKGYSVDGANIKIAPNQVKDFGTITFTQK